MQIAAEKNHQPESGPSNMLLLKCKKPELQMKEKKKCFSATLNFT